MLPTLPAASVHESGIVLSRSGAVPGIRRCVERREGAQETELHPSAVVRPLYRSVNQKIRYPRISQIADANIAAKVQFPPFDLLLEPQFLRNLYPRLEQRFSRILYVTPSVGVKNHLMRYSQRTYDLALSLSNYPVLQRRG